MTGSCEHAFPAHDLFLDLDGTLVDSSAGILDTLAYVMKAQGVTPRRAITRAQIGPPLRGLVEYALGDMPDRAMLAGLESAFREVYDREGYLQTKEYAGATQALSALHGSGVVLHIVTNKRLAPTELIVKMLGWKSFFTSIRTLDSCARAATKADVLRELLASCPVSVPSGQPVRWFVGDTADDCLAAQANAIDFAWASWGYGLSDTLPVAATHILGSPNDLLRFMR
jgi:phosphoglycolate phosphatase